MPPVYQLSLAAQFGKLTSHNSPLPQLTSDITAIPAQPTLRIPTVPRVLLAQRPQRSAPVDHNICAIGPNAPLTANLPGPLANPPAALLTNLSPRVSLHLWPPTLTPRPCRFRGPTRSYRMGSAMRFVFSDCSAVFIESVSQSRWQAFQAAFCRLNTSSYSESGHKSMPPGHATV